MVAINQLHKKAHKMKKKNLSKAKAYSHSKEGYRLLFKSSKTNLNIYCAIEHFELGLTFFSRNKYPEGWVVIQEALGIAYFSLRPRNNLKNIYRSIDHFMNIFTVDVKYRPKEVRQIYSYLASLVTRFLKFKDTAEAKTEKFKSYAKKLNQFFDCLMEKDKREGEKRAHQK